MSADCSKIEELSLEEQMLEIERGLTCMLDNMDAEGLILKYVLEKNGNVIECVVVEVDDRKDVVDITDDINTTLVELAGQVGLLLSILENSLEVVVASKQTVDGFELLSKHGL